MIILSLVLFYKPAGAAAPVYVPPTPPKEEVKKQYTKAELVAMAENVAATHGLNVEKFKQVITCESRWNPEAIGDNGRSFGLVQIHKPVAHHGITVAQALDPAYAMNFMAKKWVKGEQWRWTCY